MFSYALSIRSGLNVVGYRPYGSKRSEKKTKEMGLRPNGRHIPSVEHRCTSVLIWPEGSRPSFHNTVVTDPCFTDEGFQCAVEILDGLGLSFSDIGRMFITHQHGDHRLSLPPGVPKQGFRYFHPGDDKSMPGISSFHSPGHSPDLEALVFCSPSRDSVWVVGDAVLDEEWLKAWGFFWPNGYSAAEIIQTWKSVGTIIANADVIVPGHGEPITVTVSLVKELLSNFPYAKYSKDCTDVGQALRNRLEQLQSA